MAKTYIVTFTEDGVAKQEHAEIGNLDGETREQAEQTIQRIWAGALPGRTDVKVTGVVGAGTVTRAPIPPAAPIPGRGDENTIARGIAATERNK